MLLICKLLVVNRFNCMTFYHCKTRLHVINKTFTLLTYMHSYPVGLHLFLAGYWSEPYPTSILCVCMHYHTLCVYALPYFVCVCTTILCVCKEQWLWQDGTVM